MTNANAGVYQIRHLDSGKVYVGSSGNISRRWKRHREELRSNKHHSRLLQRAWLKYGEGAFAFELLEAVPDRVARVEREQHWLTATDCCNPARGYNIAPFAVSPKCSPVTEEARAKMRAARLGKRVSDETRQRMCEAQRGRTHSDEARARMSAAHTGRKLAPEHVEKIRVKMLGRPVSEETRAKISASHMAKR
jgi:group I intron endonuclease